MCLLLPRVCFIRDVSKLSAQWFSRVSQKTPPKLTKRVPEIYSKLPQHGTTNGPKTIPETLQRDVRELKANSVIWGRPKTPKWSQKITLKSQKNSFGAFEKYSKKTDFPGAVFSQFFVDFKVPWGRFRKPFGHLFGHACESENNAGACMGARLSRFRGVGIGSF